jgi:DNA-binding response OmpR family regulator
MHTITIDLNPSPENKNKKKKPKRILIVEPEPDIQYLYSLFIKYNDFGKSDIEIVNNGNKCLEVIFSTKDDNTNDYDIIIIDTHLRDISGFEVAKKIRDKLPNKRIILTTTIPLKNINDIMDSIGIKSKDVVLKPFIFSELLSVIKER